MNKSEIRKKILKIRKDEYEKKLKIDFNYIWKLFKKEKIKGNILGGYYPHNYEVNVMQILENFEKKNYHICLPKIKKNFQMDFHKWSFFQPLKINHYGIPEPIMKTLVYPDVLLIPLVAFDKRLNRLGYGGGYYDRLIKRLSRKKKIIKIGLAFSKQKVNKVPTNKYDQKLDYILTNKNFIK